MCWVMRICICIDMMPVAGGGVVIELTTILNHDSVSQPRRWSTSIVPLTNPSSSTVPDADPGPVAGCISPRIDTNAHSPPCVSESNRKVTSKPPRKLGAKLASRRQWHLADPPFTNVDPGLGKRGWHE